jgi:hypothetical protein
MSAVAPSSLPSASLPANRPLPAQAAADYALAVPQDAPRPGARLAGWGWPPGGLGPVFGAAGAVAHAGVNQWCRWRTSSASLVVHVDLSVLVWFAAMAGLLWSLHGSGRALRWAGPRWACAAARC